MAPVLRAALAVALLLPTPTLADKCAEECAHGCSKFRQDKVDFDSCQQGCKLPNASTTPQDEVDEFCRTLSLPSANFQACEAGVDMLQKCQPTLALTDKCTDACGARCSYFYEPIARKSCLEGCKLPNAKAVPQNAVDAYCRTLSIPYANFQACEIGVAILQKCTPSVAVTDKCTDVCGASCTTKFRGDKVSLDSCHEGCKLQNASTTPQDDVDEFCRLLPLPSANFKACEIAVDILQRCTKPPTPILADKCFDECAASCISKFHGDKVSLDSCHEGCKLHNASSTPQDEVDEFCRTLSLPSANFQACETGVDMLQKCKPTMVLV